MERKEAREKPMRMVPTGGIGYCLKMSVAGSRRVGGSQEKDREGENAEYGMCETAHTAS